MKCGGEVQREIGVQRDHLRYVLVDLLNQSHVLDHVVGGLGLVILVHLLNQRAVPVKHGLDLPEALAEHLPHLGVALEGVFGVGAVLQQVDDARGGGGGDGGGVGLGGG